MSDQQSVVSSVAPGDSVSSAGNKKKNRPGKNARKASSLGSAPPLNMSSMSKASAFASGAISDPVPQPGKFPVVFQVGAGEPTRDSPFAYDHRVLSDTFKDVTPRFVSNARYAEFAAHSELDESDFQKFVAKSLLLGLAQQTVHSHVNMNLPLGDFSTVNSSEVRLFSSLRAVISEFGEFSQSSLGTRFLLADYESTVSSLVFAADRIESGRSIATVFERMWLPMNPDDDRTRLIIADALNACVAEFGVYLDPTSLSRCVFRQSCDAWEGIKGFLGDPPEKDQPDVRDRFDFLFRPIVNWGELLTRLTTVNASSVLTSLGLGLSNQSTIDCPFDFRVKERFSKLSDGLLRLQTTVDKFFSSGSGLANRSVATGSAAQLSAVSTSNGVTVVRTHHALAAPEFSLLACFPVSGVFRDSHSLNVIVTTSINVAQRATEFCQMDWL